MTKRINENLEIRYDKGRPELWMSYCLFDIESLFRVHKLFIDAVDKLKDEEGFDTYELHEFIKRTTPPIELFGKINLNLE